MVVKGSILATIDFLDAKYNSTFGSTATTAGTPASFEPTYYSKLAVIEFCGWIESVMDAIADKYMLSKLETPDYIKLFKDAKEKNHGFQYNNNFRTMLCGTIGIRKTELLEKKIGAANVAVLKSVLGTLKNERNSAAHTQTNATSIFQAPSTTRSQLHQIFPILESFYNEISKMK